MDAVCSLPTLDSLRQYVHHTLCSHDGLDPEQTPLCEQLLVRSHRVCGMQFEIRGPRHVYTQAIWAGEENRILFYDSLGQRFAQTVLSEAPDPRQLAVTRQP